MLVSLHNTIPIQFQSKIIFSVVILPVKVEILSVFYIFW